MFHCSVAEMLRKVPAPELTEWYVVEHYDKYLGKDALVEDKSGNALASLLRRKTGIG